MIKRALTMRQLAIVDLISERKKAGAEYLTLDEVQARVHRWGYTAHRNSLIVSMNILCERLSELGIYIEKVEQMGRGARQTYRIKR